MDRVWMVLLKHTLVNLAFCYGQYLDVPPEPHVLVGGAFRNWLGLGL